MYVTSLRRENAEQSAEQIPVRVAQEGLHEADKEPELPAGDLGERADKQKEQPGPLG